MTSWFYQTNPKQLDPSIYRVQIWEGECWAWPVRSAARFGNVPAPGDTIVFYYTRTGGIDPGFYGWAVLEHWFPDSERQFQFRPVPPSDWLKMDPWWDRSAEKIAEGIRRGMRQRTMWAIDIATLKDIRQGVPRWLCRRTPIEN